MKFRKKPVVIEATQWHKNGDHPQDQVGEVLPDPMYSDLTYVVGEGKVVRYYRHPGVKGTEAHCDIPGTRRPQCVFTMHEHGWIDTMEGWHTVCPGDWIITGVQGEVYPCENHIFDQTYEEC